MNAIAALGFREEDLRAILRHTEHTLASLRETLGRWRQHFSYEIRRARRTVRYSSNP